MVNEERVKNLYKIAVYERDEEKKHRPTGKYYRSDYVSRQIIGSLFTGTVAYGLMALLWVIGNWSLVLDQINSLEIVGTVAVMVVIYVGFMAIYLFATFIVYLFRYTTGRKKLEEYKANLQELHQKYEREEKLKL